MRIDERTSVLRRTADDDDTTVEGRQERVIVANAEQLVIVCSLADPPPRTGFIDRCLVAAYDADIEPLLCLTKADLAGPEEVLDYYAELDLPHVLCRPDRPAGRPARRAAPTGSRSWSATPASASPPWSTGSSRTPTGRSAWSARSARAGTRRPARSRSPLPGGGWIVDTPGVRSFGIAHVDPDNLLHGFPDLVEATANCPPNCDHIGASGDCGLDALVAEGGADAAPARLLPAAAGLPAGLPRRRRRVRARRAALSVGRHGYRRLIVRTGAIVTVPGDCGRAQSVGPPMRQ